MATKHTPGPWTIEYDADGHPELGGRDDIYTSVFTESGFGSIAHVLKQKCMIMGDSAKLYQQTFEANAKLIAAAPELLEALKAALKLIESGTLRVSQDVDTSAIGQAKAAIAKATT